MVFVLPGVTKDCNPQENSKYDFGHYYKVLLTMKKKKRLKLELGIKSQTVVTERFLYLLCLVT